MRRFDIPLLLLLTCTFWGLAIRAALVLAPIPFTIGLVILGCFALATACLLTHLR